MSEARYGLTTFSSSGELQQIKYADSAVSRGATAVGVKATDGIVLAAEKKAQSPLVDTGSVQKIFVLDDHVGCTYSGIGPDARVLVDRARKSCQTYRMRFHEPIPVSQLVREIASIYQEFTQSGGVRPFGVSLLVAGADATGNHLYQLDPSGTFLAWKAVASGRGAGDAKSFLEKRVDASMALDDATKTALSTIKTSLDTEMTVANAELARIEDGVFQLMTGAEMQDHLDEM